MPGPACWTPGPSGRLPPRTVGSTGLLMSNGDPRLRCQSVCLSACLPSLPSAFGHGSVHTKAVALSSGTLALHIARPKMSRAIYRDLSRHDASCVCCSDVNLILRTSASRREQLPIEISTSQLASTLVGMTVLAVSWLRGQRSSSESGSLGTPQVIRGPGCA